MLKNPNIKRQQTITAIATAFIITSLVFFGVKLSIKFLDDPSLELTVGEQFIAFAFTDDNSGESLIIRTDKKDYSGFNSAEIYFNITNKSWSSQDVESFFYFNDGAKSVEELYVFENEGWVPVSEIRSQSAEIGSQQFGFSDSDRKSVENYTAVASFTTHINRAETKYFKAIIKYPPMSAGKFFMESFGEKGGYGHLDPWYDSKWAYRKKITIESDNVLSDEVGFPVLATTTDTDLKSTGNGGHVASSTGGDILFTDSAGNVLNWEREKYASSTGELVAWIKTDISSTTDTDLFMYYGNSQLEIDQATTTGVWDSTYAGVWHLGDFTQDQIPATTTIPDFLDSTSNNNDGTSANMVGGVTNLVSTSTIDGGVWFDGSDDYIDLGTPNMVTDTATFSTWFNMDTVSNFNGFFLTEDGATDQLLVYTGTTGRIFVQVLGGSGLAWNTSPDYDDSVWHHLTVIRNGDAIANAVLYIDSQVVALSTNGWIDPPDTAVIGGHPGFWSFNGQLDEARISSAVRSATYVKTEYNNQSNVGTFMSFGEEETGDWYDTDWKYRKRITVDSGQVLSNEPNFPVLVNTTDPRLVNNARADGYDIVFTSSDGKTVLDYEREKFTVTTGESVFWVESDISSTTDTVLYMYYGNPNQTTDLATTTGVWDTNYKGVWHLGDFNDTPATTTMPDFLDSTSNDNDGTSANMTGGVTNLVSTSTIDGGVQFDGDDDYINIARDSTLEPATAITVEAWFYWHDNTSSAYGKIVNKSYTSGIPPYLSYAIEQYLGNQQVTFNVNINGVWRRTTEVSINENEWYHLVGVWDSNTQTVNFYINGAWASSHAGASGSITYYDTPLRVGWNGYDQADTQIDGIIDEVRISSSARSATYIKTEYNNQRPNSTFLLYSPEQEPTTRKTVINTPLGTLSNGLDNGLVGYWTFDGQDTNWTTGKTYDMSGQGNTGTMTNMSTTTSPAPGISGQAFEFDGVDDYVDTGSNPSLDIPEGSASVWFRCNNASTTDQTILGKDNTGTNLGDWDIYIEESDSGDGNENKITVIMSDSSSHYYFWSNEAVRFNEWYNVGFTWGPAGMKMYVNGNEQSDNNSYTGGMTNSDATFYVGVLRTGEKQFSGFIDEVRIYNRALSATEIADLYRISSRKFTINTSLKNLNQGLDAGLVGHWTFDGQDTNWGTQKTYDSSPSGNTGTMTNMSTTTSPAPGISGQAFEFDGVDDYVYTSNSYSDPQDFTISAWFKTSSSSGKTIVQFSDQQTGEVDGSWDRTLYIGTDGKARFYCYDGNADVAVSVDQLSDGLWHHVIGIRNDITDTLSLYIDGIFNNSVANSNASNYSGYWRVGSYRNYFPPQGADGYFPGLIDEVRIYDRALSATEIADLYRKSKRRVSPN